MMIRPLACLPLAIRSSECSIPWSIEFLMMWISGSPLFSFTLLSTSVSSPNISRFISLPRLRDRSLTILGNFEKTFCIGCILIFMTASCRSEVTLSRKLVVSSRLSTLGSSECVISNFQIDNAVSCKHDLSCKVHNLIDPCHIDPESGNDLLFLAHLLH